MKKGQKIKSKEKTQIVTAICEDYSTGEYTIESCCTKQGISKRTFYYWVEEFEDIALLFKKAQEKVQEIHKGSLVNKAKTSLEKLVEGFDYFETSEEGIPTSDGNILITKVTRKRKYSPPNVAAVIFVLINLDPENWKDIRKINIDGKLKVDDLSKLSNDALEEKIRLLSSK